MPKKILIVDDRPLRRQSLLKEEWGCIDSLCNVTIMTSLPPKDNVESYDIIAIHRSYVMSHECYDYMHNMIRKDGKYVIFFSGGNNQYVLEESGRLLTLPVTDFYSQNLYPFCEELSREDDIRLMKLIYGIERWKLPILLKIRDLIWQDPEKENDDYQEEIEVLQSMLGLSELTNVDKEIRDLIE
jgi:hypothetical protein